MRDPDDTPALPIDRGALEQALRGDVRAVKAFREALAKCEPVSAAHNGLAWALLHAADPPRDGAFAVATALAQLEKHERPERLVYVSCSPGTLARDAGVLVHQGGYTLESAATELTQRGFPIRGGTIGAWETGRNVPDALALRWGRMGGCGPGASTPRASWGAATTAPNLLPSRPRRLELVQIPLVSDAEPLALSSSSTA